ncbi:hypothetical protein D3C81_1703810 [compost metagenome]
MRCGSRSLDGGQTSYIDGAVVCSTARRGAACLNPVGTSAGRDDIERALSIDKSTRSSNTARAILIGRDGQRATKRRGARNRVIYPPGSNSLIHDGRQNAIEGAEPRHAALAAMGHDVDRVTKGKRPGSTVVVDTVGSDTTGFN